MKLDMGMVIRVARESRGSCDSDASRGIIHATPCTHRRSSGQVSNAECISSFNMEYLFQIVFVMAALYQNLDSYQHGYSYSYNFTQEC